MRPSARLVIPLLLAAVTARTLAAVPAAGEQRQKAEQLFALYVALEHAFDPAVADLYSDDARIESRILNPPNPPEVRKHPARQYKDLLRQVQPIAKRRHDVSDYSAVTYTKEGERVRIRATRYAEFKKFTSPIELLVGPGPGGKWLIYEELSENHAAPPPPPPRPHGR